MFNHLIPWSEVYSEEKLILMLKLQIEVNADLNINRNHSEFTTDFLQCKSTLSKYLLFKHPVKQKIFYCI